MANRDHYTALVQIEHVSHTKEEVRRSKEYRQPVETVENREVRKVATVTVRADTIEKLIEKAQAHLALVED